MIYAQDKTGCLEEKIQTLKEDFKRKEGESKESHAKQVSGLETKLSDLRSRLKGKDDELNELSKALKAEKAEHGLKGIK